MHRLPSIASFVDSASLSVNFEFACHGGVIKISYNIGSRLKTIINIVANRIVGYQFI